MAMEKDEANYNKQLTRQIPLSQGQKLIIRANEERQITRWVVLTKMQDEESKRGNNTFLNTGFGAPCALQCALVFARPFSRRAPVGPVTPFLTSAIPGLHSALECPNPISFNSFARL
jgi:hypothetical protein